MKRVLKWVGVVVLVLVLIVAGFAAWIQFSVMPTYDVAVVEMTIPSTPERLVRGRELATSLCVHCHLDPATRIASGKEIVDLPKEFGRAFSKNITNHRTAGIGGWSDGEIVWLLRTGIHPRTGEYVPPWMPKFPRLSDEDMASIVVWLRSDDPYVAAADVPNRPAEPSFLAKFLSRIAFKPLPYPSAPVAHPDTTNSVVWGKYLALGVYDCYSCHSGDFAKMDMLTPENSFDFFAGGNMMPDAAGKAVSTSNITMDKTTGIGSWTREQFITALKTGFRPDGTQIRYPMARFVQASDASIGAIYDYLKTVPTINKSRGPVEQHDAGATASAGKKAYYKYECIRCHGESGLGIADLQLADTKYATDSLMADVIRHINTYQPESYMPKYEERIPESDMASLIAYVRQLGQASKR